MPYHIVCTVRRSFTHPHSHTGHCSHTYIQYSHHISTTIRTLFGSHTYIIRSSFTRFAHYWHTLTLFAHYSHCSHGFARPVRSRSHSLIRAVFSFIFAQYTPVPRCECDRHTLVESYRGCMYSRVGAAMGRSTRCNMFLCNLYVSPGSRRTHFL